MLAAGSWLESPLTLNIVTAVGTLLAGVGAIWLILVAGPRYRLRYGPLVHEQLDDGSWKVVIYLSSRGRRDITRQAFDAGKPIELDIGVTILKLADDVWNSLKDTRVVDVQTSGTCLLVGPGVIHRWQDLRFTLTVATMPTTFTCRASLIDVNVRYQKLSPRRRYRIAAIVGIVLAAIFYGLLVIVVLSLGVPDPWRLITFLVGGSILGVLGQWMFTHRIDYPND